MPPELGRAQSLAALCRTWGYTPEQARVAPVWVWRMTALLAEEKPEAAAAGG